MKILNHIAGLDKILLEELAEAAYMILRDKIREKNKDKNSGQDIDNERDQHASLI